MSPLSASGHVNRAGPRPGTVLPYIDAPSLEGGTVLLILRMPLWSVKHHCLAVIILKEAAAVWRFFHLSQSASAAWRHAQKPPRFPSTARRCVAFAGLLRRAVLERTRPCHGTHGLNEAFGALPVCRGQRIPDARKAVTSADADQASVAALSM